MIKRSQVSAVPGERELITEASTLGFGPGWWPDEVSVIDERTVRGLVFRRGEAMLHRGEFAGYRYRTSDLELTLTVLND